MFGWLRAAGTSASRFAVVSVHKSSLAASCQNPTLMSGRRDQICELYRQDRGLTRLTDAEFREDLCGFRIARARPYGRATGTWWR
jgi:hypothetical protein